MKLADWAASQGISYLTAYRWFKNNTLPVKAYQTQSGTIIVELEDQSNSTQSENLSLFLKKTTEFSKNESSIEDFAAWVMQNFSLNSKNEQNFQLNHNLSLTTQNVQNLSVNNLNQINCSVNSNTFDTSNLSNEVLNIKENSVSSDKDVKEFEKQLQKRGRGRPKKNEGSK